MKKGTFLIVDDDPVALEVARERLEGAGYDVQTRDRALGTSALILKDKPDYVLLDVNMPALPGEELAKFIVDRNLKCLVILHSSTEAAALEKLARDSGAAGAVQKTSDGYRFVAQVEACIARHR
jgi:DNA-binding response OmpR family regulator